MADRKTTKSPQSRAFFLEMLLNMLIFALCAVVVLQVFVEAKMSIDKSQALTHLTLQAESLAETYKSTNGESADLAAVLGIQSDGQPVTEYYDSDLNPATQQNARYSLVCAISRQDSLDVGTITAYESQGTAAETKLFSFEVKNYQPRKAGS